MDDLINEDVIISKIKNKALSTSGSHSHPFYEMLYIRSGEFNYFVDKTIIPANSNDVLLVNRNTIHKALFNSVKSSYYIVKFKPHFLSPEFKNEIEKLFSNKKISLQASDHIMLDILFSKMQHTYEDKKPHFKTIVRYQLSEIIMFLAQKLENQNDIVNIYASSVIEQIANHIHTSIVEQNGEALHLERIAEKFNVSPCHLSKKFKKETGFGLKEYILVSKISYAKKLMEVNSSIVEIAYKCSFCDSNYFSTVFKKIEGIAPREYIKYMKSLKSIK